MRPLTTTIIKPPVSYEAIGHRLFSGDVLQLTTGGTALLRAARRLCRQVFEMSNPQRAHEQYERDDFFQRAATAQKTFNTAPYKQLFRQWLAQNGIPTTSLYWDTLGLRIAPPTNSHHGGFRSFVSVHRDTWGSAIQAQINWWAPIWPLANGRTMAFYPEYWQQPLANTTRDWSFEKFLASRQHSQPGAAASYPSAPQATAAPTTPPALVRIPCGHLLIFAAAHLHASLANTTSLTRFSLEIRTVHPTHLHSTAAPNIDCASDPPLFHLFRSVSDNQRLSDSLKNKTSP